MKSDAKSGSGIYQIRNIVNDKRYIGKSNDLPQRAIRHRYLLNSKTHYNTYLQRSYEKYGSEFFVFEVLEYCGEDVLSIKEQYWIDFNDKGVLYNGDLSVVDKHHDKNPFFGKNHTLETKKKMSLAKKGMYFGSDNPNYGKKQSQDTVRKMVSNSSHTKLDAIKVLAIAQLLIDGKDHQDIAAQFGVTRTVVSRISSGARWASVTGGPIVPVVYDSDGNRILSEEHKSKIGKKRRGCKHSEATKEVMRIKALERKVNV